LSNKGLLPILWEMFPEHENLLPAYREPEPLGNAAVVRKPVLGREGANIRITEDGKTLAETAGTYDDSGFIYQAFARPGYFDGYHANIGAWMDLRSGAISPALCAQFAHACLTLPPPNWRRCGPNWIIMSAGAAHGDHCPLRSVVSSVDRAGSG